MCLRLAAESRVISAVTCQAESLPKNPPCPESSFLSIAETLRIRLPKNLHEPTQKEQVVDHHPGAARRTIRKRTGRPAARHGWWNGFTEK
jgi:hypothetical protein